MSALPNDRIAKRLGDIHACEDAADRVGEQIEQRGQEQGTEDEQR